MDVATDLVVLTYNITAKRSDGLTIPLVVTQSISKSKQGSKGPQGQAGQDAPRYLELYSYANRGAITGMNAGDLVVLYSSTQSERGIYAYVSGAWIKQTPPTQDQIMRCMFGVLDAVRQGYGVSADYIGTGATSFETLLVNFIYAQYAMITGSIRAGTRYDQSGNEVNPTQEGVWIGANGKIKGAINDVEPDQITPSFTRRQLFTASGSWTVPAHVKWVRVTAMGGGGGGGGSGGVTASGSSGTAYDGNNGGAGGASSFGSYVVANGGSGGSGTGSTGGTGANGQNGASSDYIGGYNGASGGTGTVKDFTTGSSDEITISSGAGGGRGSSAGLYDSNIEQSNASGSLTKIPTISPGAAKTNYLTATDTTGTYIANGAAGNTGAYGGGGGGATGGCYIFANPPQARGYGACGGGGGAGALRQGTFRITEVYGQSITVTVGAGGAGGSAGGGTTALGATGGNGGNGWVLVEW
jgi:hypothetical protein